MRENAENVPKSSTLTWWNSVYQFTNENNDKPENYGRTEPPEPAFVRSIHPPWESRLASGGINPAAHPL
jgi:hypothetical protein